MNCTDNTNTFIVVFATTRAFLLAEKKVSSLPHEVINTPRELYEQCGMCLRFSNDLRTKVELLLPPDREDLIYLTPNN